MATGQDIVNFAQQFLGTPYAWGGNDLNKGIDCSGLVQQVFKNFGITTARVTNDQIGEGSAVGMKGLRPGDLVFFDTDKKRAGPDHVGIYMGDGKMIHAPRPGDSVKISDITKGDYVSQFMGGRRMSGYNSVSSKDTDYIPEEEVPMTPEDLAANYGWAYGFLSGNPELKGLFGTATKETWTAETFQAEVRDTTWWKNNSETRRQAQVMKKTDPASWSAAVAAEKIKITQLAAEIGAAIPPAQLGQIAANSIETGMDEDLLRNSLGQYVTFTKDGTAKGEAGMWAYAMKRYASEMGVELSSDSLKNYAQRVVRKVASSQDFESEIRERAKGLLPGYAEAIDGGSTVKEIADPYMQMMAQELQLPYGSIKIDNPLIKSALNGLDASGKPAGVSLGDFQTQLRNDPRWRGTAAARDGATSIARTVLRDMGLTG
jgi:hypothetical protein